jgi:hypothetical protein
LIVLIVITSKTIKSSKNNQIRKTIINNQPTSNTSPFLPRRVSILFSSPNAFKALS